MTEEPLEMTDEPLEMTGEPLEPLEVLYDGNTAEQWEEELGEHRSWNKKHLYALWAIFDVPITMLDVGCGLGDLVTISRKVGCEAYGVDQLINEEHDPDIFAHHNLCEPFFLHTIVGAPSFTDVVISWEVGEHIPEAYIDIYCDTLCNNLKREGLLIFTAAHPGQGGTEHITNRPSTFWHEKFYYRGLDFRPEETNRIKIAWLNLGSPLYWLSANIMVFRK